MDTATTEIYTYWHALALHDALPICVLPVGAARRRIKAEAVVGELAGAQRSLARPREQHRHVGLAPRGVEEAAGGDKVDLDLRSEKHTSELQSLMRISYAVFCLNKKKKKGTTTT